MKIKQISPEIVYDIVTIGDEDRDARELSRLVDAKLGELLLEAREKDYKCVTIGLGDDGKPIVHEVADEA